MKALFLLAVSAVLLLPFSALAHKGTKGIVKERMENFKASQMALNQILAASKHRDFEAVLPVANQIKNWAEIMPRMFLGVTDRPPSEAASAIWKDFEEYRSAAKGYF